MTKVRWLPRHQKVRLEVALTFVSSKIPTDSREWMRAGSTRENADFSTKQADGEVVYLSRKVSELKAMIAELKEDAEEQIQKYEAAEGDRQKAIARIDDLKTDIEELDDEIEKSELDKKESREQEIKIMRLLDKKDKEVLEYEQRLYNAREGREELLPKVSRDRRAHVPAEAWPRAVQRGNKRPPSPDQRESEVGASSGSKDVGGSKESGGKGSKMEYSWTGS